MTTVTFDNRQRAQRWIGWSTFIQRWESPHMFYGPQEGPPLDRIDATQREMVLDRLYSSIRLDVVELSVRGGLQDPSLPHGTTGWSSPRPDPNGPYDWTGLTPLIAIAKSALARIESRGDVPKLFFRIGSPELWMGDGGANRLVPDRVRDYAEWATTILAKLYAETGHRPFAVSLSNEPDGMGGIGVDTLGQALVALRDRLTEAGFASTRVFGPECVTPGGTLAYVRALEAIGVGGLLQGLNYHSYDNDASVSPPLLPDLDSRRALAAWAAARSIPLYASEMGSDVKKMENRRTFWGDATTHGLAIANTVFDEILVGQVSMVQPVLLGWWTDVNPFFGCDCWVKFTFSPAPDYAFLSAAPAKYAATLGALVNAIRPDMVRVKAEVTGNDAVRVVGFIDERTGKTTLVGLNNSDVTVVCDLAQMVTVRTSTMNQVVDQPAPRTEQLTIPPKDVAVLVLG